MSDIFDDLSKFDPPADPEYTPHPCRNCDQEMEDVAGEWICGNPDCTSSPNYEGFISKAHKSATAWARGLMDRNPAEWVIIDTETTGIGNMDQVVQVSVIDGSGNVLLENVLIRPTISIPKEASGIHGIWNKTVESSPGFIDVFQKIDEATAGKFLVIYNADYDLRMLRQSGKVLDFPVELHLSGYACAMEKYAEWFGEWNDYHGSFRWQRLPGGNHTSLGDCLATLKLIERMAEEE